MGKVGSSIFAIVLFFGIIGIAAPASKNPVATQASPVRIPRALTNIIQWDPVLNSLRHVQTPSRTGPSKHQKQTLSSAVTDSLILNWYSTAGPDAVVSQDVPIASRVDRQGNLYIAAYTSQSSASSDILLLKYDTTGTVVWERRYDGPAHGDDIPTAMVLDMDGNPILTGYSAGIETGFDMVTLKYSSVGDLLWFERFNGSGSKDDFAAAVTTDNANNCYVTGSSADNNGIFHSVTMKYSAQGSLEWNRTETGTDFGNRSQSYDIVSDNSANVYIAGNNTSGFIAKYTMNGDKVWIVEQPGLYYLPNQQQYFHIAGHSLYTFGNQAGGGWGFTTNLLSFTLDGALQWSSLDTCSLTPASTIPISITSDAEGNVYTAMDGWEPGQKGYIAYVSDQTKYTSSGKVQWRTLNPAGQIGDIAVDNYGNLLLAATGVGVLSYNTAGSLQWQGDMDGCYANIQVDSIHGHVYVVGYSPYEALVMYGYVPPISPTSIRVSQFQNSGQLDWQKTYVGKSTNDNVAEIVRQESPSSFFIAGTTLSGFGQAYIAHFNNSGDLTRAQIAGDVENAITDVQFDKTGNCYVGSFEQNFYFQEYMIAKCDSGGGILWKQRFLPSPVFTIDSGGNAYTYGGVSYTVNGMLRYESNGGALSTLPLSYTILGFANEPDRSAFYSLGFQDSGGTRYYTTARYRGLTQDWIYNFPETGPLDGRPPLEMQFLANNSSNLNVLIVVSGPTTKITILNVNKQGRLNWAISPGDTGSFKSSIVATGDSSNNTFLAFINTSGVTTSLVRVRVDELGHIAWIRQEALAAGFTPVSIAADREHRTYVTGTASDGSARILEYDPQGVQIQSVALKPSGAIWVTPISTFTDSSGALYVAGTVNYLTSSEYFSAKYIHGTSSITSVQNEAGLPRSFQLAQNYPNPFNPTTTIHYQLPNASFVHLSLFNVLGQEVRTLVDNTEQPGYKSVSFDGSSLASGIYFYRISARQTAGGQAAAFTDVKKMVLIK